MTTLNKRQEAETKEHIENFLKTCTHKELIRVFNKVCELEMNKRTLIQQNRIIELLKTRGEFGITKNEAIKYADQISKLTPDRFNKLMEIAFENNAYGTTCYKFLKSLD